MWQSRFWVRKWPGLRLGVAGEPAGPWGPSAGCQGGFQSQHLGSLRQTLAAFLGLLIPLGVAGFAPLYGCLSPFGSGCGSLCTLARVGKSLLDQAVGLGRTGKGYWRGLMREAHCPQAGLSCLLLVPPNIEPGPINQAVLENTSITLECLASGVPPPGKALPLGTALPGCPLNSPSKGWGWSFAPGLWQLGGSARFAPLQGCLGLGLWGVSSLFPWSSCPGRAGR